MQCLDPDLGPDWIRILEGNDPKKEKRKKVVNFLF
jgi:hypothetical protein